MHDCAFCGSADIELITTTLEERQDGLSIRIEGVPAVTCHACEEGREPAITLGMAEALEAAYDLIFNAASASRPILTGARGPDATRKAV